MSKQRATSERQRTHSTERQRQSEKLPTRAMGEPEADPADGTPPAVLDSLRNLLAQEHMVGESAIPTRIAVTSAVRGEGVTTVSHGVAALLAHDLGKRVCWVDFKFTNTTAETHDQAGLVDVVKDLATLDSVLVETSNPLLSLLPAGATPRSRRAVLARSSGLDLVLAKLDASFDHLVFDVPPVLTSSESLPIVYLAQAHLLVVRHGSTTIPQVRDVADRLRAVPSLGVVMNQYRPHMPARLQRLFAV